jgi:hypothetical protein
MRKQLTGEPVAGKPHTGFGGRGRLPPFPTPIGIDVAMCVRCGGAVKLIARIEELALIERILEPVGV